MAAALLTVALQARGAEHELAHQQTEEVRTRVKDCIVGLRRLADSLRPAALDELGLAPGAATSSRTRRALCHVLH